MEKNSPKVNIKYARPKKINSEFSKNLRRYMNFLFLTKYPNEFSVISEASLTSHIIINGIHKENDLSTINSSKIFCPNIPINRYALSQKFGKKWHFKYLEELNTYNRLKDINKYEFADDRSKLLKQSSQKNKLVLDLNTRFLSNFPRSLSSIKSKNFDNGIVENSSMNLVKKIIKTNKENSIKRLAQINDLKIQKFNLNNAIVDSKSNKRLLLKCLGQQTFRPIKTIYKLKNQSSISRLDENTPKKFRDPLCLSSKETGEFLNSLKTTIINNENPLTKGVE